MTEGRKKRMKKSMSVWIRGGIALLTMLLFFTAAVAENAQIPILIDGVRVAFFDADGSLLTPKEENGLLYVPLQAFCENMGLSAEVQGQSVAVDGTRIGMFDEAGNFLTPVQTDGVDYVPLAPFCSALGIQIAEENGGFAVTRKKAEQPAAETKAQTGKIALTPYNFGLYFSYSLQATNVKATPAELGKNLNFYYGSSEADYVLTCEARSVFEIENVSFEVVGTLQSSVECGIDDVILQADMPASGSLNQTVHKSGVVENFSVRKESLSVRNITLNRVSGSLIVDKEKADAANLATFQKGEELMEAGKYSAAKDVFSTLSRIDYPRAQEKRDEAEKKIPEEQAQKEKNYQKAVVLEEAGDYEQAYLIYGELGQYKDSEERVISCIEKAEEEAENAEIERKYQDAVKKEEDGDYSGAFQAYEELGEYKDSIDRASFCVKKYRALNREVKIECATVTGTNYTIYTYDEQGLLQCGEYTRSDKTYTYTENYTLDSDGFILAGNRKTRSTGLLSYTSVSDIIYNEYGDDVFIKSTDHYDSNDTSNVYYSTTECWYDENDNIIKYKFGGQKREYEYRYVYDKYGRKKTRTLSEGKEVSDKIEYLYSDDGLLQQVKHLDSSGKCTQTDTYTYAYYGTERVRTEEGLAEHRERMNRLIEEAQKEPEKTYTTLKPGSKGQEVLDARMKLYELGYFKKKPTQTEYTDSMADYVKKFEKDHGLTQDGVLSPEDQKVLFGE